MQISAPLPRAILAGLLTIASSASVNAAPIALFHQHDTSGSHTYEVDTQAATLVPFVGIKGTSSGRDQEVFSLSLPKFDPALGSLTEVSLSFETDIAIRHSYLGGCESPIFLTCEFTTGAASSTRFGIDVIGTNDHILGPPGQGGIIEVPVDTRYTNAFSSSASSVLILAASRNTTAHFDVDVIPAPQEYNNFAGAGSFNIFFEMLSATNTELTCRIAVFAVCEAGVQVTNRWDVGAQVTYLYEPVVAPPPAPSAPEPVTLTLFATAIGGYALRRRHAGREFLLDDSPTSHG
jgi:hypothetical protein